MKAFKKTVHKMFHQPETRLFVIVNDILAVLTLASIFALVLETVESFAPYHDIFLAIEIVTVAAFTLEYIGRIFISERRKHYVFGFFGIVDLIAILPSYLLLTNLTFLKSARVLHVVRFLRMLRLVKLIHAREQHHGTFRRFSSIQAMNTQIYFFALFSSVIIFGTLLFAAEGEVHPGAANIPLAIVWVSKVILGGIHQFGPQTVWGDLVIIMTRFTGLLLFGFLIHIMGETVNKMLFGTADLEPVPAPVKKNRRGRYKK